MLETYVWQNRVHFTARFMYMGVFIRRVCAFLKDHLVAA